jgi:hypothetical protein
MISTIQKNNLREKMIRQNSCLLKDQVEVANLEYSLSYREW